MKQTAPTPAQAQQWANALRSGKFKQGSGRLQSNLGHCCLGVACEVFIPKEKLRIDYMKLEGHFPDDQPAAPKWLIGVNRDFEIKLGQSLSVINDGSSFAAQVRFSFDEIADLIELVYVHKALD